MSLFNSIDKSDRGVCVRASTIGSLETSQNFLKVSDFPVLSINMTPLHKNNQMRTMTMFDKASEQGCIICIDFHLNKNV